MISQNVYRYTWHWKFIALGNDARSEVFFQWNICRRIMHLGWVLVLVWLVLRFFVPEMQLAMVLVGEFSFNIKDIQDV